MSDCQIVKDLIPLYVEDLVSDESKELVEAHIITCKDCNNFYERIKKDYSGGSSEKPNDIQLHEGIMKMMKYTSTLKLSLCFVLILTAVLFSSLPVPFISTFSLLAIIPLVCTGIYKKLWPLICMNGIAAVIGGSIVAVSVSEGVFLSILQFIILILATISGHFFWRGMRMRKINTITKSVIVIGIPSLVLAFSIIANSGFTGNPVGYIVAYSDINHYLKDQYRDERLRIKGIYANWKGGGYKADVSKGSELFSIVRYSSGSIEDNREYASSHHYADHYAELMEIALDSAAKEKGYRDQYFWVTPVVDGSGKVPLKDIDFIIRFADSNEDYPKQSIMTEDHFLDLSNFTIKTLDLLSIPYRNINFQAINNNGIEMYVDLKDGLSRNNIQK